MRLIDADSLKELFPDNGEGSWTYNVTVKGYIDAQPTVDAEPIRHKHWESSNGAYLWRCSGCKCPAPKYWKPGYYDYVAVLPDYCPDCGAKMDEEEA